MARNNGYNEQEVRLFFKAHKIPEPVFEYRFHVPRRWRFDICWLPQKVFLEVQGGIWNRGRHTNGASLLKEWEKLNTAAVEGYRGLYCQPADLYKQETIDFIKGALNYEII